MVDYNNISSLNIQQNVDLLNLYGKHKAHIVCNLLKKTKGDAVLGVQRNKNPFQWQCELFQL